MRRRNPAVGEMTLEWTRLNPTSSDATRSDGCYALFAFTGALAASPHDDRVLRRTIRRIGLLDRTAVFDDDERLRQRIEAILADPKAVPPPPRGPSRDELLARLAAAPKSA
jgi:hypothetical protein